MKKYKIVLLVAIISLFNVTSTWAAIPTMPDFSLLSVKDGKMVHNSAFKDKVVLVNFFATWCGPCLKEIPSLQKLQHKYSDKNFSVVAISLDQAGPKKVKKLMKRYKINYPVLMADRQVMEGFGGVAGVPTSFLVNRDGVVVKSYPGYMPYSALEKDIKAVLAD